MNLRSVPPGRGWMSRIRGLAVVSGAAAVICVMAILPAGAAVIPGAHKPDQGVRLRFVGTGQCLALGPRPRNANALVLTACGRNRFQRWKLTNSAVQVANADAGTSEIIVNQASGLCLDGRGKGGKSGATVALRACEVDPEVPGETIDSQTWLVFDEKNIATIKNLASGLCLGQSAKAAKVSADLHQYNCDLGPRQQWKIAK